MFNPNNIRNKGFSVQKSGYDMDEVSDYLKDVADDYASVFWSHSPSIGLIAYLNYVEKKIIRYSLTAIVLFAFIIITKTLIWDGIFSDDNSYDDNYHSNFNESFGDPGSVDNPVEKFYISQF